MNGASELDATGVRKIHGAVRKADPYSLILCEKLIADGPIVRFVLAPLLVDLTG